MAAVIFPKAHIIESFIVIIYIFIPSLRLCKNPFLKGFPYLVLLFPSKHRLFLVDLIMVLAIRIINPVLHGYCAKV